MDHEGRAKRLGEKGLDDAMRAAFGGDDEEQSVLASLEEEGGFVSRIALQDVREEEGPIVRATPEQARSEGPRYQLVGEIARGGIGVVMKGRDVDLGRDVALKLLLEKHADNPEIIQRFVEEAQIGGQLQHPGIVPVHELGRGADGRPFIAMKLVKGQTLTALLMSREDPSEERRRFLTIFEQLCQTMAYAHARGVIHRDLKPSNVMVGAYGEVQVVDWGLAKVLGRGGVEDEKRATRAQVDVSIIETTRTRTPGSDSMAGSVMGTPEYMPPEQARGRVDDLDARSDVFALGAILCEILTGLPPYTGENRGPLAEALEARQEAALMRLDASRADRELTDLAKRCLLPNQASRPGDAGEVAKAVGAYLAGTEERARQAEIDAAAAEAKAGQERRARTMTMLLAATVLLAVLLGGGGYLWVESNARERAERTAGEVNVRLEEARELLGAARRSAVGDLSDWDEVRAEAERIAAFVRTTDADEVVRRRAESFLASVGEEAEEARRAAADDERDRKILRDLTAVRLVRHEGFNATDADGDFRAVFQGCGIDVDDLPAEKAAGLIRASGISADLLAALDRWIFVRARAKPKDGAGRRRLMDVACLADGDPWRERVRRLSLQNDLAGLRMLLKRASKETLEAESLRLIANAIGHAGDPGQALAALETAQRRAPRDLWVLVDLATWSTARKPPDWRQAARLLNTALALETEAAGLDLLLGNALHRVGDQDGALECWGRAAELDPERCDVAADRLVDLAMARSTPWINNEGNRMLSAPPTRALRKAAKLRPDRLDIRRNLGMCLAGLERWTEAREILEAVLQAGQDDAPLLYELGFVRWQTGDTTGAKEVWSAAAEQEPPRGARWSYANPVHREIVRSQEAPAPDAAAYLVLGHGFLTLETPEKEAALWAFREAERLAPDWKRLQVDLALGHAHVGEHDTAERILGEALRRNPRGALELNALGFAQALRGDVDRAVETWRAAIERELQDQGTKSGPSPGEGRTEVHRNVTEAVRLIWLGQNAGNRNSGPRRLFGERLQQVRTVLARETLLLGFAESVDSGVTTAHWIVLVARWLNDGGEYAAALETCGKILAKSPRHTNALGLVQGIRAWCPDRSFREPEESLRLIRLLAGKHPENAGLRCTLAVALYRVGKNEEALRELEAARKGQEEAVGSNDLIRAIAHWHLGRPEKARECYRRGAEKAIASPDYAWKQNRAEVWKEARELLGMPE